MSYIGQGYISKVWHKAVQFKIFKVVQSLNRKAFHMLHHTLFSVKSYARFINFVMFTFLLTTCEFMN